MTQVPPGPPPPPGPPQPPPVPSTSGDQPGWLRLTLQGNAISSSLITPAVTVNGYRVPVHYGDNVIPVQPGPTRVEVASQWLRRYGQASLETVVPPGGQVPVFYAPPMHQFTHGAIGHERQMRPGVAGFVVLMVVIAVFVLAVFLLPVILGS